MALSLRCAVVGAGRVGSALCSALADLDGPFGRGFDGVAHDGFVYEAVLLAVPDGRIAEAAALIPPGPLVGHCAGAVGLAVLAGHEAFGVHCDIQFFCSHVRTVLSYRYSIFGVVVLLVSVA